MSFYWRIAISFVVLVVVVLIGQSVMVSYLRESQGLFGPGNPNGVAAAVAADVGRGLEQRPDFDIDGYLRGRQPSLRQAAYILTRDGHLVSNSSRPLSDTIRRQIAAMLAGTPPTDTAVEPPTGPVVSAPIQVRGQLAGMVILPPPPRRGMLANVGELLSLPGTLILIAAAALAAVVIFASVPAASARARARGRTARRWRTGRARPGRRPRRDRARGGRLQSPGGRPGLPDRRAAAVQPAAASDARRHLARAAHAADDDPRLPRHARHAVDRHR